jgi:hypothetical protein
MATSTELVPLLNAWHRLQLGDAAPGRIDGWDVVCLTASNPAQVVLYSQVLTDFSRRGLLPPVQARRCSRIRVGRASALAARP